MILKKLLLDTALKHVKSHGWTRNSIACAATELGYPGISHGLFPNGGFDLLHYFIQNGNKHMVTKLEDIDLHGIALKERIKTAVQIRLSYNVPYLSRWPEAMALQAHPLNLPTSLHLLTSLVDEIWYQAGDKSLNVPLSPAFNCQLFIFHHKV